MYVYELAMELGLAASDLVGRAEMLGLGSLEPISELTPEQDAALRNTVPSATPARVSPDVGLPPIAPAAPVAPVAPRAAPLPPVAEFGQVSSPLSFAPPTPGGVPVASFSPAAPSPPASGGESYAPHPHPPPPMGQTGPMGQTAPLSFAPGGGSTTSPPEVFASGDGGLPPPPAPPPGADGPQDDDGTWLSNMPPPPVSSPAGGTSLAVIGGVIVVLLVAVGAVVIFAGGSDPKGTAVPVSMPTGPGPGDIPFGATTGTGAQYISDIDEFCDGYQYFHDFQVGFETKLTAAKSMATFGRWYDENDGFGAAGLGRMQSSFSPTSSVPLKSLRTYLAVLDDLARMKSVSEAKTELIGQTPSFKREIAAVDKVARKHC